MPGMTPNPLFRAHMLLLRWGAERLARKAAEGEQLADRAPSTAGDGSEERVTESIARLPGGASVGNRDSHNPSTAG